MLVCIFLLGRHPSNVAVVFLLPGNRGFRGSLTRPVLHTLAPGGADARVVRPESCPGMVPFEAAEHLGHVHVWVVQDGSGWFGAISPGHWGFQLFRCSDESACDMRKRAIPHLRVKIKSAEEEEEELLRFRSEVSGGFRSSQSAKSEDFMALITQPMDASHGLPDEARTVNHDRGPRDTLISLTLRICVTCRSPRPH